MPEKHLMEYFKFDADDLYANQNRRFTEKQRSRLINLDKSRRKLNLGIGIGLAVIGVIGPIIAVAAGFANPDPMFIAGFGCGFGLIWPLVWGGIGYWMIRSAMGKTVFKLTSVQGRANIVARESRSTDSDGHTSTTIHHELHIGGVTFGVNRNIADVIFQGDEYMIYYVEATKDIVSVEELRKM